VQTWFCATTPQMTDNNVTPLYCGLKGQLVKTGTSLLVREDHRFA